MTAPATFEQQFRTALADFVAARPRAQVFVASIPDLYWLWQLDHTNPVAQWVWDTFHICPSVLSSSGTDATRQQVVDREAALNGVLAAVCADFSQCRSDGGVVFDTRFAPADVSPVDYFHPSTTGQDHLAAVTWAAGYWPGS